MHTMHCIHDLLVHVRKSSSPIYTRRRATHTYTHTHTHIHTQTHSRQQSLKSHFFFRLLSIEPSGVVVEEETRCPFPLLFNATCSALLPSRSYKHWRPLATCCPFSITQTFASTSCSCLWCAGGCSRAYYRIVSFCTRPRSLVAPIFFSSRTPCACPSRLI